MNEPLPNARVHAVVFDFCRARPDLCIFGAQAVNAYVPEPRMTADVDIMSPTPGATASELAERLNRELHIAARVREVRAGVGFRVYPWRDEGSRHIADVRLAPRELDTETRGGLRYTSPALTIAMKVIAFAKRRLAPKGATDLADLRRLLLAFPALRTEHGAVRDELDKLGATASDYATWRELLAEPGLPDDDESGY